MTSWGKNFAAAALMIIFAFLSAPGQEIVDKTVAAVGDGVRTELITYSDLLWQLALQPGAPLDRPRSEDLNQALQVLINQRLFAMEAARLPENPPSKIEVDNKIRETVRRFPTPAEFETRLKQVGFDSVRDPAFEELMSQRVAIDKYVDFRFSAFVVVTSEEETKYYRDIYVPEFRRRSPGSLPPTLEESRAEVRTILTNQKVGAAIERFLDETKRRVTIEILSPV
ncbi:MAG: hypothetical protein ABR530_04085 [Pyrinomonadaceae bacterium]